VKYPLLISVFVMLTSSIVFSQSTEWRPSCNVRHTEVKPLRGIRIGMKSAELLRLLPGAEKDQNLRAKLDQTSGFPRFGFSEILYFESPSARTRTGVAFPYLTGEAFLGVDQMLVVFFDDQLSYFNFTYTPNYTEKYDRIQVWDRAEQLRKVFSPVLALHEDGPWTANNSDQTSLSCADFTARLEIRDSVPVLSFELNVNQSKIVDERREAERRKYRSAFKP
jgi:hypothetical protein